MKPSVLAGWYAFTGPLEGAGVPHMYLDNAQPRGLVTIGWGNLLPLSKALSLPFLRPDGSRASQAEIAAAWHAVDARQDMKTGGGVAYGRLPGNTLRLSEGAMFKVVEGQLAANDAILAARFPDWHDWPADAQLALHSWAWGVGVHRAYPRMNALLLAGDFEGASHEVGMKSGAAPCPQCDMPGRPGGGPLHSQLGCPRQGTIRHRNAHNRTLLQNAAVVVADGLDRDTLYWPRTLKAEQGRVA